MLLLGGTADLSRAQFAKAECSRSSDTTSCTHLPFLACPPAKNVLAQRDARLRHLVQAHRALVIQPSLRSR